MTELLEQIGSRFGSALKRCELTAYNEQCIEIVAEQAYEIFLALRDEFDFSQLMCISGVDYSGYGVSEWQTDVCGFSRATEACTVGRSEVDLQQLEARANHMEIRFAVVYHLLSLSRNTRLCVHVYPADDQAPVVDSVVSIWKSADWLEREVFDMFGILFHGHPDLRRILTDYNFIGHPLRKDFPLIGNVEVRYDPVQQRVIYEPVSIEARVNIPRIIRTEGVSHDD